jgi:hypothetical protein
MRYGIIAAMLVLIGQSQLQAQERFIYKPIDTQRLVVQPTNTVANATSGTVGGTLRTIGAVVANTIEDNGVVRTINNLLGRRGSLTTSQPGFSALPSPTSYQSTQYPSVFKPRAPLSSTYGQSVVFPRER